MSELISEGLQSAGVGAIVLLLAYDKVALALDRWKARRNGTVPKNGNGRPSIPCCDVLSADLKAITDNMVKVSNSLDNTTQAQRDLHNDMTTQKEVQRDLAGMVGRLLDVTNRLDGKISG